MVNLYRSLANHSHLGFVMKTLEQFREKIARKLGVRSRQEIQKEKYMQAYEVLKCFEDHRTANGKKITVGLADAFGGRILTLNSCSEVKDEEDIYREIPKPFAYIYYGTTGRWYTGKWQHNNTVGNSSSGPINSAADQNFANLEDAIEKLTEYATT